MSIDAIVANLENNFLVGLYVFLPAVVVFLVTIATKHSSFSHNNWWIAVGIGIVRIAILLITSRWRLIRTPLIALATTTSIAISYFACQAVLKDNSALTTINSNLLVIIMWFISVLVIAKLMSESHFGDLDEHTAYCNNVDSLYNKYRKHFDKNIELFFRKDPVAYRLLFAIMISEDINRPGIVRLAERMLFPYKHIATTGIMQVTAEEYLSNRKSVTIAQELIKGSYRRNKKDVKEEYTLIRAVAGDYNGGVYPELIADIYFILKESDYKYSRSSI